MPYHSWHHLQPDLEVQTVDHFDHIFLALHDEVVDFYLPTETRFDSICWWYGQSIYSVISSMFFPNNTLQFNTIVSINPGARPLSLEGVADASLKYKKRTDFYPALMWIMSSAKSLPLLNNVDITMDPSLFSYGTLSNKGNRHGTCYHARLHSEAQRRFSADSRPSGGYPTMVHHLAGLIHCCHPYWLKVSLAAALLAAHSHPSKHGFRTLDAGPNSLWNPDIRANDWLLQVGSSPPSPPSPLQPMV